LNFLKSVGAQGVIIWELSNDVWEGNKRDVQAGGTSVIQALDVWEGNKRDVQAGGTSVIQALYQNSGNPATRPVLPSKIKRPDLEELIKNRQFPQTDWLSVALNEKELVLLYDISAEPYYQWWVLYRGVMPDWDDLNKNKEKWDWFYSNSETNKEGSVKFDYNFTPGAIYTLALFKDQTKDAYDLADYVEFRLLPQDDTLSNLNISGKTFTFDYQISAEPYYQWWVLYRGVMPDWDALNKNKEKWDWVYSQSETDKKGTVKFDDYNFTPGAIYTLALFKDQTKDAYDLTDYVEFRVPPQDDTLSNLNISGKTLTFDYQISAEPYYQWWVLYRGVMPDWDALNKNKEKWDWVYSQSETDKKGTVKFDDYNFTPGAIYTLALFKDQTKDAYDLADYLEFIAFQGDNSSDLPAWIEVHGDNSYCYCACNSATDNKHRHASRHTMNVKAGAPYFYAVLTKDDDSIDFPTGVILEIQRPDGSYIHRHDKQENQLVSMAGGGSSVHCLIVKDPMPGDWKMTMTVPEGVGFHCECNTVPSKDPYKTITTTLTPNLNKRGLDNDVTIAGWLGAAATGATIGAVIGTAVPGVGTFIGGFVGAVVGNITSAATHLFPPSPTSTLQTATNLGYASQTFSVSPTPEPSRQQGRYNLLMEERPNTIYPNLVNFNTDLTRLVTTEVTFQSK
jgi:hypothetical protein